MADGTQEVAQANRPRSTPRQQHLGSRGVFLLGILDISGDRLIESIDHLVEVGALHPDIQIDAKAFPALSIRVGVAKIGPRIEPLVHGQNIGQGQPDVKTTAKLALLTLLD